MPLKRGQKRTAEQRYDSERVHLLAALTAGPPDRRVQQAVLHAAERWLVAYPLDLGVLNAVVHYLDRPMPTEEAL